MIDVENQIFGKIMNALRAEYESIFVSGEYTKSLAIFPAVTIEEKSNVAYVKTQDSGSLENHAGLMYEVNVYSNKQTGKKTQCKEIFALIDEEFQKLGFTRTLKEPVPNLDNATIYRMVGRYTAAVSKKERIYRR